MGQKSVAVGLKILINQKKICQSKAIAPNNVLIMYSSRFTKVKPIFHTNPTQSISIEHNCCFLKYCFLCNKTLRLDKEVYMYKYVYYTLSVSIYLLYFHFFFKCVFLLFLLYDIFAMNDRISLESKRRK
uniref:Putative ovule protein n=1 Tax=Solanum chacoense TaxID=4108 RepID=A0A0V0GYV1_SOLCH